MLLIKPVCENCGRHLPNESNEAMICTFECTFCKECVDGILKNVCPNCGGGFEKRSSRPVTCATKYCVSNYPPETKEYVSPVNQESLKLLQDIFLEVNPRLR